MFKSFLTLACPSVRALSKAECRSRTGVGAAELPRGLKLHGKTTGNPGLVSVLGFLMPPHPQ